MQRKKMLIAVLALALCIGLVFASYTFFMSTVNVTVAEPFKFGINYVGWEESDAVGDPMGYSYYSQASPFTCSVLLRAGESSHGNPDVPEAIRDLMPILTVGGTPAEGPAPWPGLHTFNSMMVANEAVLDIDVTFTVSGQTADVYMVTWEGTTVSVLNGYTVTVPGEGFIMRGIGVVAEGDAVPDAYTFTVVVSRG
jgi:hypothetical protein